MACTSNQIEKADTVREMGSALSSAGHWERALERPKNHSLHPSLLLIHFVGILSLLCSTYIGCLNQIAA
jgi:hypothetical protein